MSEQTIEKPEDIWDKNNQEGIFAILSKLETDLGLPQGFCANLYKEDDWSFIIKLHALFEAAVTHLLVAHLGEEALLNVFAKLDMSKVDTGKVAFAKALNLLDGEQRAFVSILSSLRDKLVHDVTKVAFDLRGYVSSLDHNQKTNFVSAAGYAVRQSQGAGDKLAQVVVSEPRTHLWSSGYIF